jgi:hypothetical protein
MCRSIVPVQEGGVFGIVPGGTYVVEGERGGAAFGALLVGRGGEGGEGRCGNYEKRFI